MTSIQNQGPQPLFFGTKQVRLFGCLHLAPTEVAQPVGMVVCNSFGFESLHAHRSLREFALAAAAAGVPTLRFDYFGCGNSGGDEYEPELLKRWVQSVHLAVDELKRRTGIGRAWLLGLRLGALLATLAAQDRDDVAGLVAIAPVLQGRQYVREMLALYAAGSSQEVIGNNGEALVEAGGFFLTASTAQALSAVDLRTLDKAPAQRVLIVQRDDMPASSRWPDALASLGADVRNEAWPGYAAMMEDPQRTQVPEQMIHNTVLAIQAWEQDSQVPPVTEPTGMDTVHAAQQADHYQAQGFQETLVHLDVDGTRLFGVLTKPATLDPLTEVVAEKPSMGVLLLNQGCVHHIGPSRLWVTQARAWAGKGLVVLRIDLSGLGESAPRPGLEPNLAYSPLAMDDIEVALQALREACAGGGCYALGICSGAYHAFQSAVTGKALTSAVVINPWIFSVTEARALNVAIKDYELDAVSSDFKKKLLSWEPWKKLLTGKLDYQYVSRFFVKRTKQLVVPILKALALKAGIHLSTPLSRELEQASQNLTKLHLVFAEGDEGFDVLQRNAEHAMGKLRGQEKLSIDFIPHADHTFTTFSARKKLLEVLNSRIGI